MNPSLIILESFKVYAYNEAYYRVAFTCERCGNRTHELDRMMFPEITFESFLSRVFIFHKHVGGR